MKNGPDKFVNGTDKEMEVKSVVEGVKPSGGVTVSSRENYLAYHLVSISKEMCSNENQIKVLNKTVKTLHKEEVVDEVVIDVLEAKIAELKDSNDKLSQKALTEMCRNGEVSLHEMLYYFSVDVFDSNVEVGVMFRDGMVEVYYKVRGKKAKEHPGAYAQVKEKKPSVNSIKIATYKATFMLIKRLVSAGVLSLE